MTRPLPWSTLRRSLLQRTGIASPVMAVALLVISALLFTDTTMRRQDGWGAGEPQAIDVVLLLLAILPVFVARIAPLPALIVAFGALLALVGDHTAVTAQIAVAWTAVVAAEFGTRRRAVLIMVGGALTSLGLLIDANDLGWSLPAIVLSLFSGAVPGLVGEAIRSERELADQYRDNAHRLEQLSDAEVQRAVADERVRIAREVHDVVGHHLSAISLQAAAGARKAEDAEEARHALEAIRRSSREALDQTRRTLGMLRSHDDGAAGTGTAPVPSLTGLEHLVETTRASGVAVQLAITGDRRPLPDPVEQCAFRIVQEALTNVAKHARPAEAEVQVRYGARAIHLHVLDHGAGAPAEPNGWPGPVRAEGASAGVVPAGVFAAASRRGRRGQGLVGMRERAALVGGRVLAGPRAEGGWRVDAELPIESDDRAGVPA
ncbi:sensor histidine kinase [Patulibacter defluvii]|uniref:sensor histidine kinase n=1 Tax=Patulibacter defluvii TaxID=3095358 RepID=UPI002A753193|nr:histidine kinase [Patulibacter sp. DM4]